MLVDIAIPKTIIAIIKVINKLNLVSAVLGKLNNSISFNIIKITTYIFICTENNKNTTL